MLHYSKKRNVIVSRLPANKRLGLEIVCERYGVPIETVPAWLLQKPPERLEAYLKAMQQQNAFESVAKSQSQVLVTPKPPVKTPDNSLELLIARQRKRKLPRVKGPKLVKPKPVKKPSTLNELLIAVKVSPKQKVLANRQFAHAIAKSLNEKKFSKKTIPLLVWALGFGGKSAVPKKPKQKKAKKPKAAKERKFTAVEQRILNLQLRLAKVGTARLADFQAKLKTRFSELRESYTLAPNKAKKRALLTHMARVQELLEAIDPLVPPAANKKTVQPGQ